jgi:hypothetical protein
MRMRLLPLVLSLVLVTAVPASAATKTETASSGPVTAALTYDYTQTDNGGYEFSRLHVTIDRAGVRLVDKAVGNEGDWPASAGRRGVSSVTVRDLDGDGEPEVLVDLYTGGANCCWYSDGFRYDAAQNQYIEQTLRPMMSFPYTLKDIDRDGHVEFRSADYRFAYKYGTNVDTPRPLRLFDWNAGNLVDVTRHFPALAAADAADMYKGYLRYRRVKGANVRGLLAAYAASSYNAGNGRVAWRRVVAAYRRGDVSKKADSEPGPHGKAYLTSLRRFLKKTGYLR